MAALNVKQRVWHPFVAFEDREAAGAALAEYMRRGAVEAPLVLGLPRGGVAVGSRISDAYGGVLLPLVVRKLPIPMAPEMGFGAVAIDGTRVLNEPIVRDFGISDDEVERITQAVRREVRRRAREYVGYDEPPDVRGKNVIIADDGLATGFTAIVAARMVRRQDPASLALAVPVSPADTIVNVSEYFDKTYCLFVQESHPFAVAAFYQDFHDMSDEEVRRYLFGRGAAGRPKAAPTHGAAVPPQGAGQP